jgi:hypothetical protein
MFKTKSGKMVPRIATYQDCLNDPELLRRIGMSRKEVEERIKAGRIGGKAKSQKKAA